VRRHQLRVWGLWATLQSALYRAAAGGNGAAAGLIRFSFPSAATVSFLDVVDDDWLVGGGDGRLYRLSGEGRLVARVRVGSSALFHVRDCAQEVVAVCCYPVAGRSPPNLWFVDAPAPVRLPDQYPWPDHLIGSYGDYLLAQRPHGRTLGLIDESGALAVQLRRARRPPVKCHVPASCGGIVPASDEPFQDLGVMLIWCPNLDIAFRVPFSAASSTRRTAQPSARPIGRSCGPEPFSAGARGAHFSQSVGPAWRVVVYRRSSSSTRFDEGWFSRICLVMRLVVRPDNISWPTRGPNVDWRLAQPCGAELTPES
jgi:hypothetical protein